MLQLTMCWGYWGWKMIDAVRHIYEFFKFSLFLLLFFSVLNKFILVLLTPPIVHPHVTPFLLKPELVVVITLSCTATDKGWFATQNDLEFHRENLSSHMGTNTIKIYDGTSLLTVYFVNGRTQWELHMHAENGFGTTSYVATFLVSGMAQIVLKCHHSCKSFVTS
jgi:hypothetical protein